MPPTEPATPRSVVRPPFRVALAQIEPKLGDLNANVKLHLEQIEIARSQNADLVVFPELSLTGYYLRDHVVDVSEPAGGAKTGAIVAASAETAIVFGFVEESTDHRFYNSAAFADRGSIVAVHRKAYLPTYGMFDEQRYFAAGDRVRGFDTRFGRIGLLICEDAWHLSCGLILMADRVDALIVVANSPGRGVEGAELGSKLSWDMLTRTLAQFLGVAVVFVNRTGYEDGVYFWGGSRVIDATGTIVAEASEGSAEVVIATVDPRDARRQRILAPLARDERIDLTIAELSRARDRLLKEDRHV
jgi:NAD+ synthase (glutamine-hydrolysing)